MELIDVMRTTATVRDFTDEPVSDEQLHDILDNARFAPSGGNRQGWHVVVVKDRDVRRQIRDLYLEPWYRYLAQTKAGLVGWAPITDREAERVAELLADEVAREAASGPGGFAEHLDEVPVLLIVLIDLRAIAATDRDSGHYNVIGGASVYPFVWNILLGARNVGLGGVMTSMLAKNEDKLRRLLNIPDEFVFAAGIALGHPKRRLLKLRRLGVDSFTTVDRFDGAAFEPPL